MAERMPTVYPCVPGHEIVGRVAETGRIRIGITYTVAGYFLLRHHVRFRQTFPSIAVELSEMPRELLEPFFAAAQLLSRAVPRAMDKPGSFVAMNNVVSQSVPHLHCHVVPRRRKDGLRGFFWPRTKYASEAEMEEVAARVRKAVDAQRAKG